jgi:hypothetical protein
MRAAAFSLCGVALLIAMSGTFGEAEAGDCGAAVEAAKAEWRSLTKGNHIVAPSTRIDTSDGRHLTGSQLKLFLDPARPRGERLRRGAGRDGDGLPR